MAERDASEPIGGANGEPRLFAGEVLHVCRRILAAENPWSEMRLDDLDGYMRPVLVELLNERRDPDNEARVHRMRVAAHEHGAFRRSQDCSAGNLQCEFDVLRYAIESCLGRSGMSAPIMRPMLVALNSEFRLIQSAMTGGWYHPSVASKKWRSS